MNEQRSRNSLIFLTTLSVYLGLVLVGSCPSVLAQAATTPHFDVRNEAVVEDDLDKKPDEPTIDAELLSYCTSTLETFIDDLAPLDSLTDAKKSAVPFDIVLKPSRTERNVASSVFTTDDEQRADIFAAWVNDLMWSRHQNSLSSTDFAHSTNTDLSVNRQLVMLTTNLPRASIDEPAS